MPEASPVLIQAFTDQTIIGWRHLVRGRLAKSWEIVIQDAIDNKVKTVGTKPNKKRITLAEAWGKKLILLIWQHSVKTWEIRNTAVQKVYTDRGLTRDHELLILAAEHERGIQEPEELQDRAAEIIRTTDFEQCIQILSNIGYRILRKQ